MHNPVSNETELIIGGVKTKVIIDSGASCNVMSRDMWENLKKNKIICVSNKTDQIIKSYGNSKPLNVIGKFSADVEAKCNEKQLSDCKFLVIAEHAKTILGLESATKLGLLKIGEQVNQVKSNVDWGRLYPTVFKEDDNKLEKLKGIQVKIPIDETVKPVAQNLRRVPYNLKSKVEEQINKLLEADIIEAVEGPSEWVSNIVLVPKPGKQDYRLCVDMRIANKAIVRERHQLPTIEETFQELEGAQIFTKLDVKWAFHQLELSPESRLITTFSTHMGLFRYKRLMFGIKNGPEKFQKIMDQILAHCEGVVDFADDIFVWGKDKKEHGRRLHQVLQVLSEKGVTLNPKKCSFGVEKIKFLGHEVSSKGILPSEENKKTILEFRQPKSSEEVQSFLGLVNFSSRFIPNLATINKPLRRLIRKGVKFHWGRTEEKSFQELKNAIVSPEILGFYNREAETSIWTDASPVGLGAVLVQIQNKTP